MPNPRTAGNAAVAAAAQLGALTASKPRMTTRPEVLDILRALDQTSLDLSSLDIPGGLPDSGPDLRREQPNLRPEQPNLRPESVEGHPSAPTSSADIAEGS